MLFSSLTFLFIFLPLVLLMYYISGRKLKNSVLLIFSLVFYAYGEPKYLIIMVVSIMVNYIIGLLVDRYRDRQILIKIILTTTVIINLGIIGYYKYTDFFIQNFNKLFNKSILVRNIAMPIGISFFTFQGLSYVIDIYRGNGKVQKNPLNVALYISLFPQLIAGPIVRYETIADQIHNRIETIEGFSFGIKRFILGLSKKILIANNIGLIADEVFNIMTPKLSVLLAWIGIVSYTGQIYFDFSGYSDMAIGLGYMFGFQFLENFNYPYISRSITEFWRRWHISLGTWFRDYVYIPLGGNRVSRIKFLRNIFIVWFLTGLWHGAAWNFIVWGLYYGVILILEKLFVGKYINRLWKPFQHIYTMSIVIIGWVFFRSNSMIYARNYLFVMLGLRGQPLIDTQAIYYLIQYRYAFIISIIAATPVCQFIRKKLKRISIPYFENTVFYVIEPILLIALFLLCIMYLINSTFNPFIYFRF